MVATRPSLLTQNAADLMTRTLVLIPRDMSLPGAARLLNHAKVSGAPIVDAMGTCIGVISATDFLHHAEKGPTATRMSCTSVNAWQILDADSLPDECVADLMTPDPVTVPPSTNITALARMMIDAHIHRVIVVDEHKHPIGIVSSTDILAAVARASAAMR